MKIIALLSLLVSLAACTSISRGQPSGNPGAVTAPPTLREFRGVWVATVANIDWPSKRTLSSDQQVAEMNAILDRAAKLNLNAIVLQVRPSCDAMYPSALEPWSEYLSGRSGMGVTGAPAGYDPLKLWIDGAHARGLQLHAWINPFRARHIEAKAPDAPSHISQRRPDLVKSYDRYLWLDPGEPDARAHSLAVALDLVKRYDLDGLHFDDYFYPYPKANEEFPDDASYAKHVQMARSQGHEPLARGDWRRSNIDGFVQDLYREIKAAKPWVLVGISPFGIWRPGFPAGVKGFDAYDKLAADAKRWLNEGWLDYCAPQLYWKITAPGQPFEPLLTWWIGENLKGRHVWPGLNASRVGSTEKEPFAAEEITRQVEIVQGVAQRGGPSPRTSAGVVLYSVIALMQNRGGLADRLALTFRMPALIPASPWLAGDRPLPARPITSTEANSTGTLITLTAPIGTDVQIFVAWVSEAGATSPRLVLVPKADARLSLPAGASARVACVDRYGRIGALTKVEP